MDAEVTGTEQQVDAETPKIVIDQAFIEKRPLSYSSAKHFRKSPRHYYMYVTKPKKPTDAMYLGNIVECFVYMPKLFNDRYMITTKPNLQSNKGKEEWANILTLASKNKQLICTPDQLKIAGYCKESLLSTRESARFLDAITKIQVKLEWRDRANNIPIIGYVDFESKAFDEDFIVDFKTTKDSDPEEFNKDIFNSDYQYYLQAGCYLAGYHKVKYRFPYFVNIAVETSDPYCVSVNYFDAKTAEIAKNEFYGTLKAFRYCLNNNLFHQGYEFRLPESLGYFSVKVPGWFKPRYPGGFEE